MPTAVSKPPKIDPAEAEERRQKSRRNHKRLLAERRQLTAKAQVILNRVRGLDAKRENAAASHQEVTGPIQNELSKLEGQITSLIVERKAVPETLETRRRELMENIMDANRILEDSVQAIGREQDKLRCEANVFQKGSGESTVIENELCSRPLARPDWLLEQYAISQSLHFLDLRVDAAAKRLELCQQRNADSDNYVQDARDGFAWHLQKAEFEYAAATAESAAAHRRGKELREAMLNE